MEGLLRGTVKSGLVCHFSRICLDRCCGPEKSLGGLCCVDEIIYMSQVCVRARSHEIKGNDTSQFFYAYLFLMFI